MNFSIVDGHCDTLVKAYEEGKTLLNNDLHVDFKRLYNYNAPVQFFAVWLDKKYYPEAFDRTNRIIDFFEDELHKSADIAAKVLNLNDILKNKTEGKISALLAIEGGEAIEGSLDKLQKLYDRGIRAMTLTWNYANRIADGAGVENPSGLTEFGRDCVAKMNKMGMIVDVSHLSDKGFWDVCETAVNPFIATHSNARAICGAKRNLTDKQIKALAEKGGIMGVNLYSSFIAENGPGTVDDILNHIEHIINVGGEDVLGLGCDFDGIDSMPEDIYGIQSLENLLNTISVRFGDRLTEKISEKNFLRVLRDILK